MIDRFGQAIAERIRKPVLDASGQADGHGGALVEPIRWRLELVSRQ